MNLSEKIYSLTDRNAGMFYLAQTMSTMLSLDSQNLDDDLTGFIYTIIESAWESASDEEKQVFILDGRKILDTLAETVSGIEEMVDAVMESNSDK